MTIHVKLYAIVRDRAGRSLIELELPEGSTVEQAAAELGRQFPQIEPFLKRAAFAVNQDYVARVRTLNDGDEVAVIPPVSGGRR